jgi:hypothetical protein
LWGWLGVNWWIWGGVIVTEVENWDSIINGDTDSFSSDVEVNTDSTIMRILGVLENAVDSLWDTSNCRSRREEPAISKSTLFGSFWGDSFGTPKKWWVRSSWELTWSLPDNTVF